MERLIRNYSFSDAMALPRYYCAADGLKEILQPKIDTKGNYERPNCCKTKHVIRRKMRRC